MLNSKRQTRSILSSCQPSDDDHRAAMVGLSALLKSHIFQDLKETVYFDALNPEWTSSFAEKLAPNNNVL